MSFLITDVYAAGDVAGQAAQGGLMSMLPMLMIFFGLMYFMVLRPQQKRAKEHKGLMADLTTGDEVATAGGIVGKIVRVEGDFVVLSIANGCDMMLQKASIILFLRKKLGINT